MRISYSDFERVIFGKFFRRFSKGIFSTRAPNWVNRSQTVISARIVGILLIGMPRHHFNEISDERRYQAFYNGRIATNHMLLVHISLVILSHHYKEPSLEWIFITVVGIFQLNSFTQRQSKRLSQTEDGRSVSIEIFYHNFYQIRGEALEGFVRGQAVCNNIPTGWIRYIPGHCRVAN